MDIYKAIRELVEEKKRIDKIIASLEAMLARKGIAENAEAIVKSLPKRRGRKSMSSDERKLVSERMSRYWAAKRDGRGQTTDPPPSPSKTDPTS